MSLNHVIEIEVVTTVVGTEEKIFIVTEAVQGPPGPGGSGGGSNIEVLAGENLGGHRLVILNEVGRALYADSSQIDHLHRVVGITTGAADVDSGVSLVGNGPLSEVSWNWAVGLPIYLGTNGLLTQAVPAAPAAKFSLVVGFPTSSTSMFVNIREPITLIN